MGIKGFLRAMSPLMEETHLEQHRGKRVGVDASCWLHKGAFSCALELAQNRPTDKYVKYCMKYIRMLLHFEMRPLIVFDGCDLPLKQRENQQRRQLRKTMREQGNRYLTQGDSAQALLKYQASLSITEEMKRRFMHQLDQLNIEYIVAPYEADAQLAYLYKTEEIELCISEDSDLVVFGCNRILYKLNEKGIGSYLDMNKLKEWHPKISNSKKETAFLSVYRRLSREQQRHACILAGCDYLPSLRGLGLITATKLLLEHRTWRNVVQWKQRQNTTVPKTYLEEFEKAQNAFLYQKVYDRQRKDMRALHEVPQEMRFQTYDEMGELTKDYTGPLLEQEVVQGIAEGRISCKTYMVFEPLQGLPKRQSKSFPGAFKEKQQKQETKISQYFEKKAREKAVKSFRKESQSKQGMEPKQKVNFLETISAIFKTSYGGVVEREEVVQVEDEEIVVEREEEEKLKNENEKESRDISVKKKIRINTFGNTRMVRDEEVSWMGRRVEEIKKRKMNQRKNGRKLNRNPNKKGKGKEMKQQKKLTQYFAPIYSLD